MFIVVVVVNYRHWLTYKSKHLCIRTQTHSFKWREDLHFHADKLSFICTFVCLLGAKLCMFRCYAMWEYKRIRLRVRIRIGVPSVLLPIPLQHNVQVHFEPICFYSDIFLVASFSSCFPLLFPQMVAGDCGNISMYVYVHVHVFAPCCVLFFVCCLQKDFCCFICSASLITYGMCELVSVCALCVELYYFFVAYPFSWGLFCLFFPRGFSIYIS